MAAMAAAALLASSLALGCCSPSTTVVQASSRPSSAFSSRSSLSVSRFSARGLSNWSSVPRVVNANLRSRIMAATQGSTAEGVVQADGILPDTESPLKLTYLEGNSWLWEVMGLKILVDPVFVGNLDYGLPWLYDGAKITFKDFKLEDLPKLDYLLITQGYDDHCHEKTIESLSRLQPNLPVIASPNAQPKLSKYFKNVTYLEPKGEKVTLTSRNGADIVVRASPGPILGPPWQRPENGYFIEVKEPKFTLYYEPHCVFQNARLEQEQADVIVTPVIKQVLPKYTLVSGQEDAVQIAEWLKPKFVVTMKNGDLNAKGILTKLIHAEGTTESFQELLAQKLPHVKVLQPIPGIPLEVPVA